MPDEQRPRPAKFIQPPPNRESAVADRESHARAIRAGLDQIASIRNDAQVYRTANEHLGHASVELASQADALWPRASWQSDDSIGPPTAHRIDAKIESITASQAKGPQVALLVEVTQRGYSHENVTFRLPLAAAEPLARALLEQAEFWRHDGA